MNASTRVPVMFAVGFLICAIPARSQQPSQPATFVRINCVKVRDGKGTEFRAFLNDVTLKLAKVRLATPGTNMITFGIAQAVAPTGRSARCDYSLVTQYQGFPSEPSGPEQTAADMKKAGITMTREAMVEKRDQLSFLVATEIWRGVAGVGAIKKGGFVRVNYDKIKPGMTNDWIRAQRDGWGPLAEAASKEYGTAWRASVLSMPGGEDLPFNAMTVDFFPSWEALGKGIPTRALWNKVHPDRDSTAHFDQQSAIRSRPRVDTSRVMEMLTK